MITPNLSEPALSALRNATVTEDTLRLPPGRLERWAWQQVVAALTLIGGGGAWRKADRRFVFPRDPRAELASFLALQTGEGRGGIDDVDRTDGAALVPAWSLLELADRLDTLAWTRPLEGEGQRPSWCWRVAADSLRTTVVNGQAQPAGWVVAHHDRDGQPCPEVYLIPAGELWPHPAVAIRREGDPRGAWRCTNGAWLSDGEVHCHGQRLILAADLMELAETWDMWLQVAAQQGVVPETSRGEALVQSCLRDLRSTLLGASPDPSGPTLREGDLEPTSPVRDRYGRRWAPETRTADDFVGWVYRPPRLEPHWATWGQLTVQMAPLIPEGQTQ